MLIGKKFNELTTEEYIFYIENHKQYSDFNTLGLYRSIIENDKLSIDEKIKIREQAHVIFKKSFDFLQLKDPHVFVEVSTLGETLTKADVGRVWEEVKKNQQKILNDKRIKHRSFGTYSKHSCPYPDCVYQGLMIRQGYQFGWTEMHFTSDKHSYFGKVKSEKAKSERKKEKLLINKELNEQ